MLYLLLLILVALTLLNRKQKEKFENPEVSDELKKITSLLQTYKTKRNSVRNVLEEIKSAKGQVIKNLDNMFSQATNSTVPLPEISDSGLKSLLEKHFHKYVTTNTNKTTEPVSTEVVVVNEKDEIPVSEAVNSVNEAVNSVSTAVNSIKEENIIEPTIEDKEHISKETTTQVVEEPYIVHSGKPSAQLPSQSFVLNGVTQSTNLK
jgi:hypothetical protein